MQLEQKFNIDLEDRESLMYFILSMKEKKCPMCRECISISESEYSHYE